jgi:hypothetical protein
MVTKSDMKANQMNGLYPIIRRVRRPLLPVEAPADAKPAIVPAQAEKPEQVAQGEQQKSKDEHDETTATETPY